MAKAEYTTTIEDFINTGNGSTSNYFNYSFINQAQNGTWVTVLNVVTDYLDELRNASVTVELTKEQQRTYFYKPKLLCYDIYGNPEIYYVILLINDMADVKEFNKSKLKMLRKDHMSMLMGYIYNAEKAAISAYNNKILSTDQS